MRQPLSSTTGSGNRRRVCRTRHGFRNLTFPFLAINWMSWDCFIKSRAHKRFTNIKNCNGTLRKNSQPFAAGFFNLRQDFWIIISRASELTALTIFKVQSCSKLSILCPRNNFGNWKLLVVVAFNLKLHKPCPWVTEFLYAVFTVPFVVHREFLKISFKFLQPLSSCRWACSCPPWPSSLLCSHLWAVHKTTSLIWSS